MVTGGGRSYPPSVIFVLGGGLSMSCGKSLRLIASLAVLGAFAPGVPTAAAADSTWTAVSGSFSTAGNWNAGVPGVTTGTTSTDVATFQRSSFTSSGIVVMDAAYNLGSIVFNNNSTGGNTITLSGTSAGAVTPNVTMSNGWSIRNSGTGTNTATNVIDVNLVLMGTGTIRNDFGNTVFNVGISSGASANVITTGSNLGAIDLVFSGSSTASNLQSLRMNQAVGTTLRLVKEGTGFWQLNGPASGISGLTGGFLLRQGGVSIGKSNGASIGAGPVVIGDGATTAGELRLAMGSSVTIANSIAIPSSAATSVIIERGGGSGGGTLSGTMTLGRDIVIRQATTATQTLAFGAASLVTGTGNLLITSTVASAGAVNLSGGVNMTGTLTNQSTLATGLVTVSGVIGSNVTGVVQNSASSRMTLNAANLYAGPTTIRSGTLSLGAAGSFANSQTITIGDAGSSGAVLDLTAKTGTFTLNAGQNVKGIGTTNFGDGKTVAVAGVWAPGNSIGSNAVTGNLALSGTSQFELGTPGTTSASPGTSDFTAVSGTLTLGGDLALLDNANAGGLGSYGAGAYRLFTAPTVSGSFASVTAPTGATSTRVGMVYSSGTASGEGVFANVYNLAAASAAQTVNVGTMLAGSTKTAAVSLTNSAPANATYTETLSTAGFSSTSPGFTASGSLSGLAGGASGTGTLLVGLGSGLTAGVATGSTSLALLSNAVNSSGLADLSVGSQTITITGTVLDAATAQFSGVSSGTNWSLDLGQFLQGSGTSAPTLFDVTNVLQAVGFTADLSLITFTPTLDSGVISTNLNLGSFATLQAGGTNQFSAVMALDTVGSFTNVYQLAFDSTSGGVSLGGGPQEVTLTVTGAVVPEPHGLVLACCGVALAGWAMRRRCHF